MSNITNKSPHPARMGRHAICNRYFFSLSGCLIIHEVSASSFIHFLLNSFFQHDITTTSVVLCTEHNSCVLILHDGKQTSSWSKQQQQTVLEAEYSYSTIGIQLRYIWIYLCIPYCCCDRHETNDDADFINSHQQFLTTREHWTLFNNTLFLL